MNVDKARERLADARATLCLYDELVVQAEGALTALRVGQADAAETVRIREGELIFAERMD
jgi:hypothetical protein